MKKCLLLGFLLLIAGITYAQVTVTGTVSAASDGEAIPGVSIIIKGTTKGVTTDLEGNYTITADADNVLVYSFIGYKPQEMSIGNQSVINIQLEEDISNLEEFVVVGYGTMKKSDMSSAHVTVTSEDIEKTVNTTIEQAIQGRAAGVYVTKNTEIGRAHV